MSDSMFNKEESPRYSGATIKYPRYLLVFALTFILWAAALVGHLMGQNAGHLAPATGDDASRGAVLDVFRSLEKAEQTGDGKLYLSVQSMKKLDEAGKKLIDHISKGFPPDPSVRYQLVGVRIRNNHAAVLGKITRSTSPAPQYYLGKLVLEKGAWKIAEDLLDQRPIDASALEAAVPPAGGAFSHSGSPWKKVPYARINTKWFKENQIDWKLQATADESFLYIRFESKTPLPAPGTEIPRTDKGEGIPPSPNVMVISTAGGKNFSLVLGSNPMTRATFDEAGRATSNRFFVQYSFALKNPAGATLFSDSTRDTFDPLIAVQDRFLDLRLPLNCLSIEVPGSRIEIKEANSLAKILPYQVGRFSR